MNRPLKLGVIGNSGYAAELIKRIWSVPYTAEVVEVASLDSEGAFSGLCRRHGARVHPNVDAMLAEARETCDAVMNPTPIHLHLPLSVKCLEYGLPVLLEKPPVATIQEFDELVRIKNRNKGRIGVCFNSLYSHLLHRLKDELVAGKYGRILGIRTVGAWIRTNAYFNRSDWSGKLMLNGNWILDGSLNNSFAHGLSNSLYLAGTDLSSFAIPETVQAELYRLPSSESESTSSVRIKAANGTSILCNFSLVAPSEMAPTTCIDTEVARIELIDFSSCRIQYHSGGLEVRETYKENRIEMLESFQRSLILDKSFDCELEGCRPFTLAVNGAFESSGFQTPVDSDEIRQEGTGESRRVFISDLNDVLRKAHESGQLISETGVKWGEEGSIVSVSDYSKFPQNPVLSSLEASSVEAIKS